ncbi:MAG TPA: metalloregulator ArsR/SmtB family transcription factor [Gemmatimonadales bacterium]|nr:metalloregulator ArsR/SmtB family transcription factor [Gemmatimonadales bacterium]
MTRYASRAAAERRLLELHAATCSILAHPTRLAMIEALRDGERTVSDLVRAVGTSAGNLSQHLGAMRDAGVVEARREGRYAFYRISDPRILTAFRLMREVLLGRLARDARLADRARRPARRTAVGQGAPGARR